MNVFENESWVNKFSNYNAIFNPRLRHGIIISIMKPFFTLKTHTLNESKRDFSPFDHRLVKLYLNERKLENRRNVGIFTQGLVVFSAYSTPPT